MGSCIFGYNVEVYGTEIEYYKALKNYITGLDTRITCDNDVDEEFDRSESGDDHVATLSFKINNVSAFKLYRNDILYRDGDWVGVRAINFDMDLGEGFDFSPEEIWFRNDNTATSYAKPDAIVRRGLLVSSIINENIIFIRFNAPKASYRDGDTATVFYSFSNNSTFVSSSNASVDTFDKAHCFNLSAHTLYDRSLIIPYGTFLSRFNYAAPAGEIDYIKSSIYQSSNEKRFENMSLFDCTTVTAGSTVSLKDGAYLAVGSHQLVKVS